MGSVLGLCGNKWIFTLFMLIGGSVLAESDCSFKSDGGVFKLHVSMKNIEKYDQDKDDEQLVAEIWNIGSMIYKNMIDMSALYFSGILLDTNHLYDRMMVDLGKNLFHVVKLLALYGPKMLKNPNISWQIKAKKTGYMISFLVVFWLWSQEVSKQKQRRNIYQSETYDTSLHRSVGINNVSEELLSHRPRPSVW